MTDEDYARFISEAFMSPEISILLSQPRADFNDLKSNLERRYGIKIDDSYKDLTDDGPFPEIGLELVTKLAKNIASKHYEDSNNIVVKFVPNWAINGQIIINPTTMNPIVLINLGLTGSLQFALNSYLAITSKNHSHNLLPFSFSDLYKEIIEVAEMSANGDKKSFKYNFAKDGSTDSVFNKGVIYLTVMLEVFIILHELSHISLGHVQKIDPSLPQDAPKDAQPLHIIERSLQKEITADMQAYKWLTSSNDGVHLEEQDALFILGFYFLYSELCHNVDRRDFSESNFTYPEFVYRWELMKTATRIERFQGAPVWEIDAWFSRIASELVTTRNTPV